MRVSTDCGAVGERSTFGETSGYRGRAQSIITPFLAFFMKKNLLSALYSALLTGIILLAAGASAQAKIWRVDNNGGSPGDFTTAQAAHDAAAVVTNDTLYFNGSGTSYGDLTLNKRLYVFGPGYFLTQNPQTQAAPDPAILGTLRVNPSAAGSIVTGMTVYRAWLFASNTLFKRNRVESNTYAVLIGDNGQVAGTYTPSNVLCIQNYVTTVNGNRALWVASGCSNIIVTNNLLYAGNNPGYEAVYALSSMIFSNNVVYGVLNTTSTNVTNTYLYGGSLGGGSNSYNNNICDGTQFPTGSGNIQNQVIANVCVNSGSPDGAFVLKTGSPAIGTGVGGVDMGLYGGADPYVLSGLPAIPAIWSISAPSSGSGASGLNVNIKAKSHN